MFPGPLEKNSNPSLHNPCYFLCHQDNQSSQLSVSLSGDPMDIPAWIIIIITDGGMEDGMAARCLPLLVGLSEDITHIKETLNIAMDKVARVEMEVLEMKIFLKGCIKNNWN